MMNVVIRKMLSLVTAAVLLAVTVLGTTSCNRTIGEKATATTKQAELAKPIEIGEGAKSFTFSITFYDGTGKVYYVKTDAMTVGEALSGVGLISGEYGPYGLYVKTVDGETLDYDTHKKYWAFYVNGELSETGVDRTNITEGILYTFRAE